MKRPPMPPRSVALTASLPLQRQHPKVAGRKKPGKTRQDRLRAAAQAIVRVRSGGRCEATTVHADTFDWAAVDFLRERYRCLMPGVDYQHRRARGMGGSLDETTETAADLIHTCRVHHDAVEHVNRAMGRKLGWVIFHGVNDDPATIPCLLWCGWVLLGSDGSMTPVETP